MDKRTRVLTAMDAGEVDHVPVGFWFHFAGEGASGEACVQAHLKYYRETDLDFLKVMCDGYFPYPVSEKITSASDWKKLEPLDRNDPFICGQVERAARIVQEGKISRKFFHCSMENSESAPSMKKNSCSGYISRSALIVLYVYECFLDDAS